MKDNFDGVLPLLVSRLSTLKTEENEQSTHSYFHSKGKLGLERKEVSHLVKKDNERQFDAGEHKNHQRMAESLLKMAEKEKEYDDNREATLKRIKEFRDEINTILDEFEKVFMEFNQQSKISKDFLSDFLDGQLNDDEKLKEQLAGAQYSFIQEQHEHFLTKRFLLHIEEAAKSFEKYRKSWLIRLELMRKECSPYSFFNSVRSAKLAEKVVGGSFHTENRCMAISNFNHELFLLAAGEISCLDGVTGNILNKFTLDMKNSTTHSSIECNPFVHNVLAVICYYKIVYIVDFSGKLLCKLEENLHEGRDIRRAIWISENQILCAYEGEMIKCFSTTNPNGMQTFSSEKKIGTIDALASDGVSLALGTSSSGMVEVLDIQSKDFNLLWNFTLLSQKIVSIQINSANDILAVASEEELSFYVLSIKEKTVSIQLREIYCIFLSPVSNFLVVIHGENISSLLTASGSLEKVDFNIREKRLRGARINWETRMIYLAYPNSSVEFLHLE